MNDRPPRLPAPVITLALIALNVLAFGYQLARGGDVMSPSPVLLRDLGANFGPYTLTDEPWRLVTTMFLHGGVLHLAANMVGLWFLGSVVERCYGRVAFAALYLLSGLAGGVATMVMDPSTISVGASGAVFGAFGALGAWLLVHRKRIDPQAVRQTASRLGLLLLINLAIAASVPNIDNSAHVGGLVSGFLLAVAMEWPLGGSRSWRRVALVAAAGVAAVAVTTAALPAPRVSGLLLAPAAHQEAYLEFDRVHRRALLTFNELILGSRDGAVAEAELAARLERDIIAPWRELQGSLRALPPPPGRSLAIHEAVLAYVDARLTEWLAVDDLARGRPYEQAQLKELRERADGALAHLERLLAEP